MHFNKITIYVHFCNNIVFWRKKLIKAVSSDIAETDNMPQIMNEAKLLKTLSSICGSTPTIYLILTHWWAPGETQELMTTRMYSNLFRGSGWGESSLSNFYTGPMFIKNDASSGTTRCWSKASCIDITNAQLQSQLMQLRKKKAWKNRRLARINPGLRYRGRALTNLRRQAT